ncbi:MAG: LysM peptidoglycan-binding domain-containing protein [Puniceicoccaceae bacterium]
MKFFKVFSLVILGHILLIGAFLLQPGCQSIDRQWEEHRKAKRSVNVPREVLAQEQGLPPDSEEVDSSFNSGFAGSGASARPRSTPTRPRDSSEGSAGAGPAGLEPVEPLFNQGPEDEFNGGEASGGEGSAPSPSPTSGYVPYTVQRGDTLWGLSKEYNVPFAALLEANGMDRDSQLRVGQEIVVPSGYDAVDADAPDSEGPVPEPGTSIYEVRRGDTLSEIAARAGTSVSRIKNLNNMTGDRIRIGQRLIVPGDMVAPDDDPAESRAVDIDPDDYSAVHTVRSGETPAGIANRYGMSVEELLAANGIPDARRMRAGAELKVKPAGSDSKLSSGDDAGSGGRILPERSPEPLPPRAEDPVSTPPAEALGPEDSPAAPEIVPEVNAVEPEEGFGEDIFLDFEGVEEVPTERRDADGE